MKNTASAAGARRQWKRQAGRFNERPDGRGGQGMMEAKMQSGRIKQNAR